MPTLSAEDIGIAKQTGRLDLSRHDLTVLPAEIAQLTSLQALMLDGNQLTALPPEIAQLTSLQTLSLNGNQLAALPAGIGQLTGLQTLLLDGNRLTALPPQFAQLSNLQTLWLSSNQLTALPPEIAQLTSLQTLCLSSNQLAALPAGIGQLTGLQTLLLDGNRLTALPPQFAQLSNLQTLWLSSNQLTALPPEIAQLTSLKTLWLDSNGLAALPPEIGNLTNLQELTLNSNELTALPRQLADLLVSGLDLQLDFNPLAVPLPELIRRGSADLAVYLRSLEDAVAQHEAKVLLVGEGKVGKTSLSAALRGEPFIEGRPFTHGIEIRPLALSHPDKDVMMTIRLWDFGGQEVYRVTHQFFFSPRGLYLVVWNPRKGQEQDEVEGWLRRIRLRAVSDARALVVATHCPEGMEPELDYPRLEQLFPRLLAGRFTVDNKSSGGIERLRGAIASQVAMLPQVGQLISSRWVAVRQRVASLAKTEPQISFEAFTVICHQHGVHGQEIGTLAALMHEVGQIIYYGDDEGLQDFVVLNPEWLTKAISYVLHDDPTRKAAGELDHQRLRKIWRNGAEGGVYAVRYHRYFLRLMEKFDICYRLDEHRSLVAQLVPYERPTLPWDFGSPLPRRYRRLSLVCRLREQAPGLMAWLTVQRHPDATGLHWRNGVFLRYQIRAYDSEALMELRNPDQLDLAIEVRAPSPDFFFHVLSDTIETLISKRWPGLVYTMLIPCPGRMPDGAPCGSLIPVYDLTVYREEGLNPYLCTACRTRHDVTTLLTGFSPTTAARPDTELLAQIASGVGRIEYGIDRIDGREAELADSLRQILRALSTEVSDCPLLFTLTQTPPTAARRVRMDRLYFRLTLWCEHPGHWHPWTAATYDFDQPREWLVRVSPYVNLVLRILRSAVPVAAAVAGELMTDEQLKHASAELQLMTTLANELPSVGPSSSTALHPIAGPPKARAQGQAMRAIRGMIFQRDKARSFGDMRRVLTSSGDYLWICPDHYGSYDPGLPAIPGS